jgi:acetoin utilization deacetylase AcuC-like enzyme
LAIRQGLEDAALLERLERAQPEPVQRALLEAVHDPAYVAYVERLSAAGGGDLDADTHVSDATFDVALLAAGAVTGAVERVLSGAWTRAFCSVRPPGHHATRERGMGFCIFNNVAVGAVAVLGHPAIERVAILDWDVHHGNGTQDIFYDDPRVLYASSHQSPLYPSTGHSSERGEGAGRGTVLNCPLPAGAGDAAWLDAWERRVAPAFHAYRPQFLLISAGFDADTRDPLAGLSVTPDGFAALSRAVVAWADRHAQGRLVSVLEGGYHLEALREDVALHVQALFESEAEA